MKVLHLAAGNRWTGAAAPAFAEVQALRGAGIDAHYAYVGGYKLQAKLARFDYAHPIIAKAQNPISFLRTAGAIERFIDGHRFDVIHAHLTYDHWLARIASRGRRIRVARTFHSRRTLRNEPFTRMLLSRTNAIFIINQDLVNAPVLDGREVTFTPPPLDAEQFSPSGRNVRAKYGIGAEVPVISIIGKLSKDRGFEAALETFAAVRATMPNARLLLIGHGEHREALEQFARSLEVEKAIVWAGYHEDDLADHYRAADVLLFTASGSDEGHRAVIEAMSCGVAPATFPIDGMTAILGDLAGEHISPLATAASLAAVVTKLVRKNPDTRAREVNLRSRLFTYSRAAARLIDAYSTVL